ncbi:hypothetical protein NP233_g119 [Leucocoprinus birnbaumii]|uniref:SH3 domain-containing protein n=1 Tax=Leucocoprinus birnbaumii TaxID=56174 RepID=A0AAD5W3F2_9AGAR|nr:hypothetical protein NP233_g119 [Leucocoprinus birnbaumii]
MAPLSYGSYNRTSTTSLHSSWDPTESLHKTRSPYTLDNAAAMALVLPTVTETMSIFVTVTQLQIATVTAMVKEKEIVTVTSSIREMTVSTDGTRMLGDARTRNAKASPPSSTRSFTTSAPSSTSSSISSTTALSSSQASSTSSSSTNTSSSSTSDASSPTTTASDTTSPGKAPIPGVPLPSQSALSDQSSTSTISSGAVVGITIGCILFTLLLAVCFIRQRLRRKRIQERRWVTPFVEKKRPAPRPSVNQRQQKRMEYVAERLAARMRSLRGGQSLGQSGSSQRAEASTSARVANVEQATRNRVRVNGQTRTAQMSSVAAPPTAYRERPSARQPVQDDSLLSSLLTKGAVARMNFEPSRPDELAVSPGDSLRVVALYHDGWAQCKNLYGGKGMVPTACLRVNDGQRMG